jgi:hypothetical protein
VPDRSEARALADQMLSIIEELQQGESHKRDLVLGTQDFLDKALEIEGLSRLAFRWSHLQREVAERATFRGESQDAVPLIEVEARPLDVVLAQWREMQLRLEIAAPGSPEAIAATDGIERLREEYQAVYQGKAG